MLKDLLGKEVLFFDGGTGTVLQEMGLKPGELPETWNIKYPEKIINLHYQYFCAGSNIINTNTFGAFITKFPLNLEKIICAAVKNADAAREQFNQDCTDAPNSKKTFIAFDIGSCGKLLKPMGDLDFEDCISLYKKSFKIALNCKIDCIMIETMNDGYETKAAVLAAKETMEESGINLPIIVSNVYDCSCRTLSGSSPETMTAMLEGLKVDAIGVNCSLGPKEMQPVVKRLCNFASVPILVKPNAGLPKIIDKKTVFDVSSDDFVNSMIEISKSGVAILGGCCGTTPKYIKKLSANAEIFNKNFNSAKKQKKSKTKCTGYVSSNTQIVFFGGKNPPVLIGERINPTGKKKFKEALRNNDIPYIIRQGLEQEENGAQILDVNVGLPEIDEKEMMLKTITELQAVTNLPLQIDTTNPAVMETALRRYNGKPMINSVNGKQETMNRIFPLVKKYGGLVVALTLDENGIPADSKSRIKIAQKIYDEAKKYGISKNDIIVDPLAMAVSSDSNAAIATLETICAIHKKGGLTSLGISNVSFGLPNREFVTSSFFTMAMTNGLSAAIMNPLQTEMKKAYKCFCLLNGKDKNCSNYILWSQEYDKKNAQSILIPANPAEKIQQNSQTAFSALSNSIIHGLKNDAAEITKKMLQTTECLEIINNHIIPGLDFVGKYFEQKTMYLPQLLTAAEAAKSSFSEIRNFMEKTGKKGKSKGKIVTATVKGDIHDIGKNIVKVLLENYDFEVIDLGKDVPPQTIVKICKEQNIKLAGLSALMTTTVVSMEETIKQLHAESPNTKICVGGAVMTQEYADKIGADFYAKDAMDTVRYALKLFDEQ